MNSFSGRSLASFLLDTAVSHPLLPALEYGSEKLSFGALASRAAGVSETLRTQGLTLGDRVFLVAGNSIEYCVAFWACQLAGGVLVPVHPDTQADKLAWMIDDAAPVLILTDARSASHVRSAAALAQHRPLVNEIRTDLAAPLPNKLLASGEDLAAIIYTSGSTSTPKGVMLSHKNMVAAATSVSTYLQYDPSDRIYCAVPFSFDYGLHQITMTARVGATLIIARDFSQPIMNLNAIAISKATVVPLVPSIAALLLPFKGRFDLGAVRVITNTAAALAPRLIDDLGAFFPEARIFSMYGLTECHRCTYLEPDQLAIRKMSVGKAIPFTSMWVIDEAGKRHDRGATGELVIRGETVMQGYWKNPEATAARLKKDSETGEIVLHTGDQVRLDDEGYAYFIGRQDDILKIRGIKVAPVSVEHKLSFHPDIAQVAVLASPCSIAGARLTAFVEPKRASCLTAEAVLKWCQTRFEIHERPSDCVVMTALPKNQNGKIDRLVLAKTKLSEPA